MVQRPHAPFDERLKRVFVCVISRDVAESPRLTLDALGAGAKMVTDNDEAVKEALDLLRLTSVKGKGVRGESSGTKRGEVKCPVCRKRSRVPEELPENKLLKTVVDATRRAEQEACPHHPETRAEYFCNTCDVITCDKCALLGGHRGHDICELATAAAACRAGLQRVQAGLSEREQAAAAARGRIDATYNGLKSRVDEEAQAVIDEVNRQRVIAKQDLDMHVLM